MEQPKVGEEIRKMPVEPLLPVEKKLIAWSLTLGAVLLVILIVLTRAFPVSGGLTGLLELGPGLADHARGHVSLLAQEGRERFG